MDAEHGPEVQEPENKEAGGDKGEPAKEVKAEQGMEMDPERSRRLRKEQRTWSWGSLGVQTGCKYFIL